MKKSATVKLTAAVVVLTTSLSSSIALAQDHAPGEREKRWKADGFVLEVENTAPLIDRKDVITGLEYGAATWNAVGASTEIHVVKSHSQGDEWESIALDGVNRVSVYKGEWPYPPQAGAVTVAWAKKNPVGDVDEIVEADLALNPAFDWTLDHDDETGLYDLKNVLTHELGHSLGLPDIKDPRDATMFYLILPGETLKRDLSDEDTRMLLKLYENIDDDGRQGGCSATGTNDAPAVAAVIMLALTVARRRAVKGGVR